MSNKPPVADLVGQSLMLSVPGTTATSEVVEALARTRAGGVILFARNIESPRRLHSLTTELQRAAQELGLPSLLIGLDQEGGIVTRLPAPFVTMPSQMAQAASADPEVAHACALLSAQQLRATGVNTNFAPVLDVNCNPANPVIGTRSFGEDPDEVARFGVRALQGYRDGGVIATGKHFPGHGDTHLDSHYGLPTLSHDRERLREVELRPFVEAIGAGIPALMTAHIIFEALAGEPATLSSAILTDLLRGELGYPGVVFTDALDMAAISLTYGPIEAARLAKAAGADVVIPLGTLADQIEVAASLQESLRLGTIEVSAFEQTAFRLDRLRRAYRISHAPAEFEEIPPSLWDRVRALASRGTTVVRGADWLPLAPSARLAVVDCVVPRWSPAEEPLDKAALFLSMVRESFPNAIGVSVAARPSQADRTTVLGAVKDTKADFVLLVTRNARVLTEQIDLARAIVAAGKALIHVAARNPYDVELSPDAAISLLTYGDPPVSLQAVIDVLAGRAVAGGHSPVTLATG